MTRSASGRSRTVIAVGTAGVLALGVSACGGSESSSSSAMDPIATALQTPGVRTVLIAKQKFDLEVIVPPCPRPGEKAAANPESEQDVQTGRVTPPEGSQRVIIPRGTLTQTVAVQPCQTDSEGHSSSSSSSSSSSTAATGQTVSTLLLTPGGQAPQGSQIQEQAGQTQNQLVLPSNANIQTLVIPPCTQPEQSASSSQQSPPQKNLVLPADSRTKSATAPACTVQQQG